MQPVQFPGDQPVIRDWSIHSSTHSHREPRMGMRSIAVKLSLIFGAALAATILAITLYATLNVRRQAIDNFNDAGLGQIRQIDTSLRETFKRIHDNVVFLSDLPLVQSADPSVTNYLTHGGQMTPDT